MFESDAIVYSVNRRTRRHWSELLLPRCINVIIGDVKRSLISSVYVLSDIFYFDLASASDSSRLVMINNTNSVPNLAVFMKAHASLLHII